MLFNIGSPATLHTKGQMTYPPLNHLLNALPLPDYERIEAQLEIVTLNMGEVLYESGDRMRHAFSRPRPSFHFSMHLKTDPAWKSQ